MKMRDILNSVLASVSPSPKEALEERKFAHVVSARLRRFVPKGAKVQVMGSLAKGTFLRDSKDTDIFILLPKSASHADFEKIVRNSVSHAFPKAKKELKYAEHPYVRLFIKERRVDVVPAYNIKSAEEKASSVDRSVLHIKYVLSNLPKSARADVLLLKKFMKSNCLYGAEIRVEGFSGYLCELLIIRYGSFLRALKEISKWKLKWKSKLKLPEFIDLARHYENKKDALSRFPNSPLIVIDPVDKNRNVAAIVSIGRMGELARAARGFLRHPALENFHFTEKDMLARRLKLLSMKKGVLFCIELPSPHIIDDILWGQIKRIMRLLETWLEKNDFEVNGMLADSDGKKVTIFLSIKNDVLSAKMLLPGPPVKKEFEKNVADFKKAHRNPGSRIVVKAGRVYAEVPRAIRNADVAIKLFFKTRILPSHFMKKRGLASIRRVGGR